LDKASISVALVMTNLYIESVSYWKSSVPAENSEDPLIECNRTTSTSFNDTKPTTWKSRHRRIVGGEM
jgi:hypothetical protein